MNQQVTIEEHEMPPEMPRIFEQGRRNLFWFSENAEKLGVYERYRGRYVAAAGGELFVADTPEEVRHLAQEKHLDEISHVRYIPREKRYRIYGGRTANFNDYAMNGVLSGTGNRTLYIGAAGVTLICDSRDSPREAFPHGPRD